MSSVSEATARQAPGFSIAVPGDWIIVDLEEVRSPDVVEQLINRRIDSDQLAAESREAAIDLITRTAAGAVDSGVQLTAVLVATDAGGTFLASVTASCIEIREPDPTAGGGSDAEFFEQREVDARDVARAVEAHSSSSEQVTLPAGPAIRIERLVSLPLGGSLSQDLYSVQYVVPAGGGDIAIVLTGTSTAVRRKADLDRVFGEIAETLAIDRPA